MAATSCAPWTLLPVARHTSGKQTALCIPTAWPTKFVSVFGAGPMVCLSCSRTCHMQHVHQPAVLWCAAPCKLCGAVTCCVVVHRAVPCCAVRCHAQVHCEPEAPHQAAQWGDHQWCLAHTQVRLDWCGLRQGGLLLMAPGCQGQCYARTQPNRDTFRAHQSLYLPAVVTTDATMAVLSCAS
jgi:hypothetical protein